MIWAVSPIALWVLFLAYSAIWAKRDVLRIEVKSIGFVVVLIGWVVDVAFNWTLGLMLGITKDLTFSQKCGRLKYVDGWRSSVAKYLCKNWLDPFEVGGHCK